MNYFVPKDTNELINNKEIENFSLRFNKFVKRDFNEEKQKYEFKIQDVKLSFGKQLQDIERQQQKAIELYKDYVVINAKNNWRLAIGIGSGNVYESSITLHHVYGIPYIPAQSIKGSFRSYIVHKYFKDELFSDKYKDRYDKFEDEVLYKCDWFVDIFGSNEKQGKVIFFDAFTEESSIQMDIMNNHYQKYYNGKEAPTDTQNPNPINFLTLKNSTFRVIFAVKDRFNIYNEENKDVLDFVKEELINSLKQFGVGAKTSVGYGYFDIIKTKEEKEFERKCNDAWIKVKNSSSIDDLEAFISSYPNSKYFEEAKKRKAKLASMTPSQRIIEEYSDIAVLINDMKSGKIENFEEIKVELAKEIKKILQQNPKTWDKAKKKALDRRNYIEGLLK